MQIHCLLSLPFHLGTHQPCRTQRVRTETASFSHPPSPTSSALENGTASLPTAHAILTHCFTSKIQGWGVQKAVYSCECVEPFILVLLYYYSY